MKKIKLFYAVVLLSSQTFGQILTVASYNLENFFDSQRNTDSSYPYDDSEYTPANGWTQEKYQLKAYRVAHAILNLKGFNGYTPDVLGVIEVENQAALNEMNQHLGNQRYSYSFITRGPDTRGINVGVLSKYPFCADPIVRAYQPPGLPKPTRALLAATICIGSSPITVIVNHWPSRSAGAEASEPHRVYMAQALRSLYTEISQNDPTRPIIMLGDFNDEPENQSLYSYLQAKDPTDRGDLYNLNFEIANFTRVERTAYLSQMRGSYNYRGSWDSIDQMVVNFNATRTTNIVTYRPKSFHPSHNPFVDNNGTPVRFLNRDKTVTPNGLTDHLPIMAQFVINSIAQNFSLQGFVQHPPTN